MAGDMFGKGRLAMPFDITKRAFLLDPPDELMPSVKAIDVKITVDEHIMTGLSYLIKYLGLHRDAVWWIPCQRISGCLEHGAQRLFLKAFTY